MVVILILAFSLCLVNTVSSACKITPLQVERTEFGTERWHCVYEYQTGPNDTTKVQVNPGSIFEVTNQCTRCRCTPYGLECCGTGTIKQNIVNPPKGCKVIKDACDEFVVMEINNSTDCFTGLSIQEMRRRNAIRMKVENYLTQWSRQQLGLLTVAENGGGESGGETEPGPLGELRLLNMLFGGNTGLAEPLAAQVPPAVLQTLTPGHTVAVSSIGNSNIPADAPRVDTTAMLSNAGSVDTAVTSLGVGPSSGPPTDQMSGGTKADNLNLVRIPTLSRNPMSGFGGASRTDLQGLPFFKPVPRPNFLQMLAFMKLLNS